MAQEGIQLEIVTPTGLVLQATVSEFTAPSVDGEFGVLPGHRPLLAALDTGIVRYTDANGAHAVAVGQGFVEVSRERAVLLTDKFVSKEDVDPVRVRLELKHADEALDRYEGEPGAPEQAALADRQIWAATQLELYGDPPPPALRTFASTQPEPEHYERLLEDARFADEVVPEGDADTHHDAGSARH